MSQKKKILRYMKEFGSITPLEAMRDLGIMRLGARIWDLEREGHLIRHQMIRVKNRFGTETTVCQYSLLEEENA